MEEETGPELTLDAAVAAMDSKDDPAPEQDAPQDAVEEVAEEGTEETEAVAEDEAEPETDEAEAEAEPAEATDEMLVSFEDGTKVPISELRDRYIEAEELSRNTQEVAKERSELQSLGQNFAQAMERVAIFLDEMMPPEPPIELLHTDPGRHHQMQTIRAMAYQRLESILSVKEGAEQAVQTLGEAEIGAMKASEAQALLKKMPHLKESNRMEAFRRKGVEYAKSIGFPEDMIEATLDHRVLMMAYDAAFAKEAREKEAKAKAKVQKGAAPALPATQRQHPNSVNALAKVNAMKQFQKTGRLEDAIKAWDG